MTAKIIQLNRSKRRAAWRDLRERLQCTVIILPVVRIEIYDGTPPKRRRIRRPK